MINGRSGRILERRELEPTAEEGGVISDDMDPTETDMNEHIRVRRDRWMDVKAMKKEKVYCKRHSKNMEVIRWMHNEMKLTHTILQEALDQ